MANNETVFTPSGSELESNDAQTQSETPPADFIHTKKKLQYVQKHQEAHGACSAQMILGRVPARGSFLAKLTRSPLLALNHRIHLSSFTWEQGNRGSVAHGTPASSYQSSLPLEVSKYPSTCPRCWCGTTFFNYQVLEYWETISGWCEYKGIRETVHVSLNIFLQYFSARMALPRILLRAFTSFPRMSCLYN